MDLTAMLLTAPAVIGVVNLLKEYGMPTKLAPIVSVIIGIIAGIIVSYLQYGIFNPITVALGFIAGMSATGLYDVTRSAPQTNIQQVSGDNIAVSNDKSTVTMQDDISDDKEVLLHAQHLLTP